MLLIKHTGILFKWKLLISEYQSVSTSVNGNSFTTVDFLGIFFFGLFVFDVFVVILIVVGSIIVSFLISVKVYYQFEFLCDALYEIEQNEKSAYHFMKVYSLCALLLEKDVESELDYKLPGLMRKDLSLEERKEQAEFMRKIRNKVAHGDFMAVNKLLERYACKFMDGRFWFDYSEYTRESWVLLHISCELEAVLK